MLSNGQAMVLSVEDDEAFACAMARYLEGRGLPTVVVSSSMAALDILENDEAPIVITDFKFLRREPHGLSLARMIGNKGQSSVIFVTAYLDEIKDEHLLGPLFSKPIDLRQLYDEIVRRLLSNGSAMRRLGLACGESASDDARHRNESISDHARHFPPPWKIVEHVESYWVQDASGQTVGWFHFRDSPEMARHAGLLTRDEARRIATIFAKLPELARPPKAVEADRSLAALQASGSPGGQNGRVLYHVRSR
jgi:CheY-like chemotaxis protein